MASLSDTVAESAVAARSVTQTEVSAEVEIKAISVADAQAELVPVGAQDNGVPLGQAVRLNRFVPSAIKVSCMPESIEVGIDCGMPDMCGLDPCLCGTPDAWGACACNGLKAVCPVVEYVSSNPSVATVETVFGKPSIVPHGQGQAQITAIASLEHHHAGQAAINVEVGSMTQTDALVGAGFVFVCVLVITLFVSVVKFARRCVGGSR